MSKDAQHGQRLRKLRKAAGVSQVDAAIAANAEMARWWDALNCAFGLSLPLDWHDIPIDRRTDRDELLCASLSRWERGERKPSPAQLAALYAALRDGG